MVQELKMEVFQLKSLKIEEIDGVAATSGPGLIGGLIVGLTTAKGIALGLNIYHVVYHGSEVTSQLFVEVALSIWILGTAIFMKNASTHKVVEEPKVDTE